MFLKYSEMPKYCKTQEHLIAEIERTAQFTLEQLELRREKEVRRGCPPEGLIRKLCMENGGPTAPVELLGNVLTFSNALNSLKVKLEKEKSVKLHFNIRIEPVVLTEGQFLEQTKGSNFRLKEPDGWLCIFVDIE